MAKPIPYDDDQEEEKDERDMRWVGIDDSDALDYMQGWTGGQSDPLYAISSMNGANYAWVFVDAIANIDSDLSRVKKIGRDKYQLGKGTFTGAEIDELQQIRDALQEGLDAGGEVRESRGVVRAAPVVRDYAVVDRQDRTVAGPFKSYQDARNAAGGAGAVKFVPNKTTARENRFSKNQFGGGDQGEALAHKALSKHELSLLPGTTVQVYRGGQTGMIGTIDTGELINGRSVAVIDADGLRWTIETRNLELRQPTTTREARRSSHHKIGLRKPKR